MQNNKDAERDYFIKIILREPFSNFVHLHFKNLVV